MVIFFETNVLCIFVAFHMHQMLLYVYQVFIYLKFYIFVFAWIHGILIKAFNGDGLGFLKQWFGPQRTTTLPKSYIALVRWLYIYIFFFAFYEKNMNASVSCNVSGSASIQPNIQWTLSLAPTLKFINAISTKWPEQNKAILFFDRKTKQYLVC